MRTGYANLPLHYGSCPPWLFKRMKLLAREITNVIVFEYGQDEILKRLSDPYWFQSFGCVLGFDWHSSGITTTVTGALKEALKGNDLGLAVCGGKGKTSRQTPKEISNAVEKFSLSTKKSDNLIYSSKMSAKIDSACIQDGYNLYHHVFVFNEKGNWCVVQQGMNESNKYARRYHWLSEIKSFVEEPNKIVCDRKEKIVLDMTAIKSKDARKISVDVVNDNLFSKQSTIKSFLEKEEILSMPQIHEIKSLNKRTITTLTKAYELQPKNYEELISLHGIGPKAIRSLALISELIYGKPPSWKDPVKFSFSHGGKNGYPFPVDRKTYDKSIDILRSAIENAKIGNREKMFALKRLNEFLI